GHGVHPHRHVVARDHLLGRDHQRHHPQLDLDHLVDDRYQQEQAGPLRVAQQPSQPEHDAALVLAQHPNRVGKQNHDERQHHGKHDQVDHWVSSGWFSGPLGATCSVRPSTRCTTTVSPTPMSPFSASACHSAPSMNTWPLGSSGVRATASRPGMPASPAFTPATGWWRAATTLVAITASEPPNRTEIVSTTSGETPMPDPGVRNSSSPPAASAITPDRPTRPWLVT